MTPPGGQLPTALVFPGLDALQRPSEQRHALCWPEVTASVRAASATLHATAPAASATFAALCRGLAAGRTATLYQPQHAALAAALVVAVQVGIARRVLRVLGPAQALAGYSLGEVSRSVVAGVTTLADAVRIAASHADLATAGRGCSALVIGRGAVDDDHPVLAALRRAGLGVSRIAPNMVHIAGAATALDRLRTDVRRAGWHLLRSLELPVHSRLLMPVAVSVRRALRRLPLRPPNVALFASRRRAGGCPVTAPTAIASDHARSLVEPFDWPRTVQALRRAGIRRLVNIGPALALGRVCRELAPELIVYSHERA